MYLVVVDVQPVDVSIRADILHYLDTTLERTPAVKCAFELLLVGARLPGSWSNVNRHLSLKQPSGVRTPRSAAIS